jgi:hypothetical protein
VRDFNWQQAGLSRATLEISSSISSEFPHEMSHGSDEYLNSSSLKLFFKIVEVFFHWRSSSIGGHPQLEVVFHWWSYSIGVRHSLEVVFHWKLSSTGGKKFLTLISISVSLAQPILPDPPNLG